jgi:hypothetical protein
LSPLDEAVITPKTTTDLRSSNGQFGPSGAIDRIQARPA